MYRYLYDDTIFVAIHFSLPMSFWARAHTKNHFFPMLYPRDNKNIHRKFSHIQSFKSHPCTRKNDTFPHIFLCAVMNKLCDMIKMLRSFFIFRRKAFFHEFSIVIFILSAAAVRKITLAIFQCNASSGAVCIFLYKSDMNIPRTLRDLYLRIYLP